MSGEIEPASTKARIALALFVLLLLLAVLFEKRLFGWVEPWLVEDPGQTLLRFDMLMTGFAVLSLPILVAGILSVRTGARAVRTERFPPTGMWVIRDTPVQTGVSARRRGRMMQLAGALMVVIAVGFPAALWAVVRSIVAANAG